MILIGLLNLIVISVSVILIFLKMRKNHEWNRREASQDAIFNLVSENISETRHRLEVDLKLDLYDHTQDFQKFISDLNDQDRKDALFRLRLLFNYFEAVSCGIEHNVFDEDICFDYMRVIFLRYYQWGNDFINKTERQNNTPSFTRYCNVCERWKQRKDNSVKVDGKPPT